MFRSVLIIIFVIVMLFLARTVMQRLKQPRSGKKIRNKETVQCLQCKTYIPSEEAIYNGNNCFCSQQHLNDWNRSA
ncbi:hypothetical protein MNBD_GAMMA11-3050 [hydrothermal vent metagenome]|uniref:Uncharacterized protein n=1 Tax=hydrothermal vent metagenome TaxID=652676 RepID=A0A3B0X9G3_9ZZZZ